MGDADTAGVGSASHGRQNGANFLDDESIHVAAEKQPGPDLSITSLADSGLAKAMAALLIQIWQEASFDETGTLSPTRRMCFSHDSLT